MPDLPWAGSFGKASCAAGTHSFVAVLTWCLRSLEPNALAIAAGACVAAQASLPAPIAVLTCCTQMGMPRMTCRCGPLLDMRIGGHTTSPACPACFTRCINGHLACSVHYRPLRLRLCRCSGRRSLQRVAQRAQRTCSRTQMPTLHARRLSSSLTTTLLSCRCTRQGPCSVASGQLA